MVLETRSPEQTFQIGVDLAKKAVPGQVFTLTGDLGVGKTVFTQGFAHGLGITEPVNSPTFTIVQVYEGGRLPFYHFDVYRIGDVEEMDEVGFDDYYFNDDGTYDPSQHKTRIALTFDDGPGEYTDELLDCLEENNAHATFFMLGQNVGSWESTVQRMADIGCEIRSHSWDHPNLYDLSMDSVAKQFSDTDAALEKACGQKASVARAPYGNWSDDIISTVGKPFFTWSLDSMDWSYLDVNKDYDAVMNGDLTDGSIILMHDIHEPSVQAAIKMIPELVQKGYKLMTVSELAAAKGVTLQGANYSDFWDSSLQKGIVAGYSGNTTDTSGDESTDGTDTSNDGSTDTSDGSSDDGSADDESSDDGSYDDGSSDDGSYDEGDYSEE